MSQERPLPDLVLDSKIVTTITPQYTEHIYHSPGTSASTRLVRRTERWVRDEPRAFIGQGSFGTVYRERCCGKVRAVKEIRKCLVAGEELDYTRELEAVVKFSHPKYAHCFVRSDGWFESIDAVFITMEYLEHGDLHRYLARPLPEDEVKQITMQVLEGLNYMHQNGFAHRDLKPGNIMVVTPGPEWFVKIADFGISKRRIQDVTSLRTNRGTQLYQAPEMLLLGQNTQGDTYTFAVDMWSLGVVVYMMMTTMMPFPSLLDLFKYIDGLVDFPSDHLRAQNITEDAIDFVIHLLSPQPAARLTAVSATEHAWMKLAYQVSVIETLANCELEPSESYPQQEESTSFSVASGAWSSVPTTVTTTEINPALEENTEMLPSHGLEELSLREITEDPSSHEFEAPHIAEDLTHDPESAGESYVSSSSKAIPKERRTKNRAAKGKEPAKYFEKEAKLISNIRASKFLTWMYLGR